MPHLQGRVFSRFKQYQSLPDDFKAAVNALERHLMAIQNEVFENHTTGLLKSSRGVRYKLLADKVDEFLGHHTSQGTAPQETTYDNDPSLPSTGETTAAAEHTAVPVISEDTSSDVASIGAEPTLKERATKAKEELVAMADAAQSKPSPEEPETAQLPSGAPAAGAANENPPSDETNKDAKLTMTEKAAQTKEELVHKTRVVMEAARGELTAADPLLVAPARKFVVALVLKGFITPYKEDDKFSNVPETFFFKDHDLFVSVATSVTGLTVPVTTVWDLADGAVFAGLVKRKVGLLTSFTQSKDVYAMVNARGRSLTLFDSDTGCDPILQIDAVIDGAHAAYDKSQFATGVEVWNETVSEILGAASVNEREAFMEALVVVGMKSLDQLGATPTPTTTAEPERQKVATDRTGITDKVQNLNLDLPLHVPVAQHAQQNVEPTRTHDAPGAVARQPVPHEKEDPTIQPTDQMKTTYNNNEPYAHHSKNEEGTKVKHEPNFVAGNQHGSVSVT